MGTIDSSSSTRLVVLKVVSRSDATAHGATCDAGPGGGPARPTAAAAVAGAGRSPRSRCSRPTSVAPGHRPGPGTTPAAHRDSRCARSPSHPAKGAGPPRGRVASAACGSSWPEGPGPSVARWCAALVAAGHEVTVFSRSPERVAALGLPGVVPAVGDAFDSAAVVRAVQAARPEVVVNQLTSLAQSANPVAVKRGFDATGRLRTRGLGHPGRRRPCRRRAPRRRPEHLVRLPARPRRAYRVRPSVDRRHRADRPAHPVGRRARVRHAAATRAIEGVVLRYGSFYGPGTYFAPGGLYVLHDRQAPAARSRATAAACSDSCTSRTRRRRRWPRSRVRPASSTSSTTCRPRPRSGCPSWPSCSAPSHRAGYPRRSSGSEPGSSWPISCAISRPSPTSGPARELGWAPRYPDWHDGLPGRARGVVGAQRAVGGRSRFLRHNSHRASCASPGPCSDWWGWPTAAAAARRCLG